MGNQYDWTTNLHSIEFLVQITGLYLKLSGYLNQYIATFNTCHVQEIRDEEGK